MTHLVTFCDERMTISAEKLRDSSVKNWVDMAYQYEPRHLPELFKQLAKENMKVSKGYGLYVWKPWVIWDLMELQCKDGDILIYADAGQTFVSNVQAVINSMDQDIMMFSNGWPHVEWCKGDVLRAILDWDMIIDFNSKDAIIQRAYLDQYYQVKQTQASLIFFKVTPETRNFVKEWMLWCLMPGFCDDSPSKLQNYPTFQETRWDQSILCCLQIKYGYRLHWFPTLTAYHIKAEYPNDHYPAIVDHHRKRNDEW